ncbi:MAG: TIGR00282 family metallophosphoesterase [Sedimentisphaerales bacterium]|nr:TIGR00282 family metallophosphoesterase [Sedimentisphaerales bacterium]MBN2842853.1 TIGR00282 family metallophosphoesterase [Sedimentisphaerales bacterium]
MQVKILCIGDIVGRPGRQVLAEKLPQLVKEHNISCVVANAENSAGGSGITQQIHDKLLKYGVNIITLGDHVYRKKDIIPTLNNSDAIVRPANLSTHAAGKGQALFHTQEGCDVAVITLLGRLYMSMPGENPFLAIEKILSKMPSHIKIILVEMHAEASSEKVAMGRFLDGKVSLVFGTHTHIPTADEEIFPGGTGYITDIGMTGPHESVLGRNIEPVVKSLLTQMPYSYSIATRDLRINGVLVTVDSHTGKTLKIERMRVDSDMVDNIIYDQDDGSASRVNCGFDC